MGVGLAVLLPLWDDVALLLPEVLWLPLEDGLVPDGEVAPVPVVDVPGAVVTESAVVTLVEVETADVVPGDPLVAVEESVEDEEAPTQLMSAPVRTVKAPDWTVTPSLSFRVMPREVPTGWSTFHFKEVPVKFWNCSRGVAVGSAPGRMLKKKGELPPCHVICMGSQTMAFWGVFTIKV